MASSPAVRAHRLRCAVSEGFVVYRLITAAGEETLTEAEWHARGLPDPETIRRFDPPPLPFVCPGCELCRDSQ